MVKGSGLPQGLPRSVVPPGQPDPTLSLSRPSGLHLPGRPAFRPLRASGDVVSEGRRGRRGKGATYGGVAVSAEQYQYLRAMHSRGYSANRAIDTLKATGLAIRRDAALNVFRELRASQSAAAILHRTPGAFEPSDSAFIPTERLLPDNYTVYVGTIGINAETGERQAYTASVKFRNKPTPNRIRSAAMSVLSNAIDAYNLDVTEEDLFFLESYTNV